MDDLNSHNQNNSPEDQPKIQFKHKKRKPMRQRDVGSDIDNDDEPEVDLSKLEEMKTVQKLRKRPNGVSIVSLAIGEKVSFEEEDLISDPFKVKSGGMVNMKALKSGNVKQTDDAYDVGIGTQFSAETNKRDEDEEMMKYIEEQLAKKKCKTKDEKEDGQDDSSKYLSPEEAALQAVPEHLRASTTRRSEEMLSNQMLSGIPEVDLGIEAKIRNIEATEEAKLKLLWERHNKKDGPSHFVPTNMAVNFVQHNRFNIEESGPPKRRKNDFVPEKRKAGTASGSGPSKDGDDKAGGKATDDYHYERFKKQFRRY
ncbi:Telomere length and silencing protein 1-like protein [Frankliniella fusca]|uniref:Telomere length and silencing protein 1-like protein n=1 Tax=Frankliniella fusca TaxID=407009 RepID=A0AAE1LC68_9NEOP|nr:Telomere length and silencing protein 1-like protein [Frankliniella fusca]